MDDDDKPEPGGIFVALYANDPGRSRQRFRWEIYVQMDSHYGYSFALYQSSSTHSPNGFSVTYRMERDILSAPRLANVFHVANANDRGFHWRFEDRLQSILHLEQMLARRIPRSSTHPPDYCWILENLDTFQQQGMIDRHLNLRDQMALMERHGASYVPE
jgi:hypothetical protein